MSPISCRWRRQPNGRLRRRGGDARRRAKATASCAAGCRVIPVDVQRASTSAFQFARELIADRRIVRAERPDVVHCIALRVIVTAGFAAKLAGVGTLVLAPTGLGHVWTSKGLGARVVRALTRFVVARVLGGSGTRYLFENRDDPAEFGLDPEQANVTIVPGAASIRRHFH